MHRLATALVLLCACGPSDRTSPTQGAVDAGPGEGGGDGTTTRVSGTVWAPGNAPGMTVPGHEIPVSGAIVYASLTQPGPPAEQVQCIPCVEAPPNAVITDAKGNFDLDVYPGTYWLVVQKAHFRIQTQVVITEQTGMLPTEMTTLPSVTDAANGKWIPSIALASGGFDAMESILGKMGIGEVDSSGEFVAGSATGSFDVYSNGGSIDGMASGTLSDLVGNLDTMLKYQIIFIPCAGSLHSSALQNQQNLKNIRDYVALGGRLYVTDWSGEWSDNVFPTQVELGSTYDTPAAAYNQTDDTWNTAMFGDADGSPSYTSPDAEAVDQDLFDWLNGQVGPSDGGSEITIDATSMSVSGNWDHILKLNSVEVGVDDEGNPVVDAPKPYVIGSDGQPGGKKPLTVTFEPAGCGRVLYSTYHTTHSTHVGLAPQERILLYLTLEIGVCKNDSTVD